LQHLSGLAGGGIVGRRQGAIVIYSITSPTFAELRDLTRDRVREQFLQSMSAELDVVIARRVRVRPVDQEYLFDARQMQAFSFAVHIPRLLRHRVPNGTVAARW
jgi:hypothetical protein